MLEILLLILSGLTLLFGGIVFIGAPYVPTKKQQIEAALDGLNLQPGQLLLELGAGDGRVARAAAKRGIKVVGYELNPLLVAISIVTTWRYRDLVKIKWQDYWRARWPKADGIFIFSGGAYMNRLDKKIVSSRINPKVASLAFKIPGRSEPLLQSGVYIYSDYELDKLSSHR